MRRDSGRSIAIFLVVFLVCAVLAGWLGGAHSLLAQDGTVIVDEAALGSGFTYQGVLSRSAGLVSANCRMAFRVYSAQNGGSQIGNEQVIDSVAVAGGFFTVALNDNGQFGPAFANGEARWLEASVRCGNEQNDTTLPRQRITAAPYALTALSTNGLRGRPISADAPQTGQALVWNGSQWTPQGVTASPDALTCTVDQIAVHDGSAWVCSDALKELKYLLEHFSRSGNEITISGANLQIVNGAGATSTETNGLGNIIVGYNTLRATEPNTRTGSHILVIGNQNNYSGYGGIVVGYRNETSNDLASIIGGYDNVASGDYAVVIGGNTNTASGFAATISGGISNIASGGSASVSGGADNIASGNHATVTGGEQNIADSVGASISGGYQNKATAPYAAVSGGQLNEATNTYGWVGGGTYNIASGTYSAVGGGYGNKATGDKAWASGGSLNTAFGPFSSVVGGFENTVAGEKATISGGWRNKAVGVAASTTGGYDNNASGSYASVSGGHTNTASGNFASVSGGRTNAANGEYTSVSGGHENIAFGSHSSVSGGRNNIATGAMASLSGGQNNIAGGAYSSVSGGLGDPNNNHGVAEGDHDWLAGALYQND